MANEQGGNIIYGIEERGDGAFRRAVAVEEGFRREDGMSRERFLQFARDRISPPLNDLDAFDVALNDERTRFALVVEVPQARGQARQTGDLFFWRRSAQGIHRMTAQEIEDVRGRAIHPRLELSVRVQTYNLTWAPGRQIAADCQFRIENTSGAVASFVVVTLGIATPSSVTLGTGSRWRRFEISDDWKVFRFVMASGSSLDWSPITPGLMVATESVSIQTSHLEQDALRSRVLGLVRLDHEGGLDTYTLSLHHNAADMSQKIRVVRISGDGSEFFPPELPIPKLFQSPPSP